MGCGAAHSSSVHRTANGELDVRRLREVEDQAPELAELIECFWSEALRREEQGELRVAQEFFRMSKIALLSASELITRLELAEQIRIVVERPALPSEEPGSAPPPDAAESDRGSTVADAGRPRTRRSVRENQRAEPSPVDESVQIRERLADLANRLSRLQPDEDHRVAFESAQNALIEADRALAQGELERAEEFIREVERQLMTLLGEDAPSSSIVITHDVRV